MTISLKRHLLTVAALAVAVSPLGAAPSEATQPSARSTGVSVTIAGNDSPYGEVRSTRRICKANVTVRVYRQIGTRGGGDDQSVGSPDTTGLQGGRWTWSIGNPGLDDGDKVYAKVRAHDGCRVAYSPTMTVDRS